MRLWKNRSDEDSLKRIVSYLNAAQKGDYSLNLPATSEGELGELEKGIIRIVQQLREVREGHEEQRVLQRELKVSRVIQSKLLPSSPPTIPGLEILSFYKPASEIGGDYYDFIQIDPTHMGIAIADVSGKSVSGAMLMTIVRNTLRAQAALTCSPAEVLERTERLLLPSMMRQFFVSIFYGVLDCRSMRMICANAGHLPLLHFQASHGRCDWIRPEGIAVGLCRNGTTPVAGEEKEVHLEQGDLLFFYTDGITETVSPTGRFFGRERLGEVALKYAPRGGKAFFEALERELASFSGDLEQADDMTAVLVRRSDEVDHRQEVKVADVGL